MLWSVSNHKTYRKQVESFLILALDLFILISKLLPSGKDSENRSDLSTVFMERRIVRFLPKDLSEENFKSGSPEKTYHDVVSGNELVRLIKLRN